MKLNEEPETPLPDFAQLSENLPFDLSVTLLRTLAQADHLPWCEQVIFAQFDHWITRYSQQELTRLLTCDGVLDIDTLSLVQQHALEQKVPTVAIYCYTRMGIGQLEKESETYFRQLSKQAMSLPEQELPRQLSIFRLLFDRVPEHLNLMELSTLLSRNQDSTQLASEILVFLDSVSTKDTLMMLYDVLKGHYVCCDPRIFSAITKLSRQFDAKVENLRFFHETVQSPAASDQPQFQLAMCELYYAALTEDYFLPDYSDHAQQLCLRLFKDSQNTDTLLCLYLLQLFTGRKLYADAVLYYLHTQSDSLDEPLAQQGSQWVGQRWPTQTPTQFTLYLRVLEESSPEEISLYQQFCSSFLLPQPQALQALQDSTKEDIPFSNEETDLVVRTLFSAPTSNEYWPLYNRLPLDADSLAYAKFYYLNRSKGPKEWAHCLELCFAQEQAPSLQLSALLAWMEVPDQDLFHWQEYILEKLESDHKPLKLLLEKDLSAQLLNSSLSHLNTSPNASYYTLKVSLLLCTVSGHSSHLTILRQWADHLLLREHRNLGIVLLVHLLLAERFEEAWDLLSSLRKVHPIKPCCEESLVRESAIQDLKTLKQWFHSEGNQTFLRILLPDANQLNIQQLNSLTAQSMLHGTARQTALALQRMLLDSKDDYGICNAIFTLCTAGFDGYTDILQSCLTQLSKLEPRDQNYYRHTKKDYANMLAALAAVKNLPYPNKTHSIYNEVTSDLQNYSEREKELRCQAYLSCITGNWSQPLAHWKDPHLLNQLLHISISKNVNPFGLSRSLLRLFITLPEQERPSFLETLNTLWNDLSLGYERRNQLNFVRFFCSPGEGFDQLCQEELRLPVAGDLNTLLCFPFEDYSLFSWLKSSVLTPATQLPAEALAALVQLSGSLVCIDNVMIEFSKSADIAFKSAQDKVAYSYYRAMHQLNKMFHLVKDKFASTDSRPWNVQRCEHKARSRIAGLSAGVDSVRNIVSGESFAPWSILNMVTALLYTNFRSREDLRLLEETLHPRRQPFLERIYKFIDPEQLDADKLQLLWDVAPEGSDDDARIEQLYLAYFLAESQSVLHTESSREKARTLYQTLSQAFREDGSIMHKNGKTPRHFVMKLNFRTGGSAAPAQGTYVQDASSQNALPRERSNSVSAEVSAVFSLPAFAQFPPIDTTREELEQLEKDYDAHKRRFIYVVDRIDRAEEILGRARTCGDPEILYRAVLRYGMDRYEQLCLDNDPPSLRQLILELMGLEIHGSIPCSQYDQLVRQTPDMLRSLLLTYSTLPEIIDSYRSHLDAYEAMCSESSDDAVALVIQLLKNLFASVTVMYLVSLYSWRTGWWSSWIISWR